MEMMKIASINRVFLRMLLQLEFEGFDETPSFTLLTICLIDYIGHLFVDLFVCSFFQKTNPCISYEIKIQDKWS
jgi:hypothetical protein